MLSLNRWACAGLLLVGNVGWAQDAKVEIAAIPVADQIYMLTGSGGNMGLSVGQDGAFLIDDQFAPLTEQIQASIRKVTDKPVKFLVNTHWHFDHTGGNENFGKAGSVIVAHNNVRKRMEAGGVIEAFKRTVEPAAPEALPVITFDTAMTFHFNGDAIRIEHPAPAHTDGDAILYFEKANVVHMGDVFFNGMYPFIDAGSGGKMKGVIDAVAGVLAKINDNTKVIPGHGALSNKAELQGYQQMLTVVYERVAAMKNAGRSVQEVVAAKPTKDLDAKWNNGFLKADQWVALVYEAI